MKHLLGNTDSLQLFPLSYPRARDMYLENMDNHSTPREISVAKDVALWRSDSLSEAERHGPIQNLARHGKFTGAAEQFQ